MPLHRRTALQVAGTAGLAALAGCGLFSQDTREFSLTIDALDESLVDHALYDPADETLFGTAARDALDAILPDGRHATSGFEPLPADAYVEREGRYYQTNAVVTGRERVERTLVRADRIDPGDVSGDPTPVDSLPRASARVVKILHSNASSDGSGSAADLLHDGAYVLRRPAERDGPIAGELDGEPVAMDEEGNWTYRLDVRSERLTEPVYETFAVEVASDRSTFSDVVLATRVDADLSGATLDVPVRRQLDEAIEVGTYRETTPLSASFRGVLDRLGLGDVGVSANGRVLWYEASAYRYGLYVSPVS